MDVLKNLAPGLFLLAAILMAVVGVRSQRGQVTPARITIYAAILSLVALWGLFGPR